jgi:hypothetical protein
MLSTISMLDTIRSAHAVPSGIDPRETPTVDHQDTQPRSDQHMQCMQCKGEYTPDKPPDRKILSTTRILNHDPISTCSACSAKGNTPQGNPQTGKYCRPPGYSTTIRSAHAMHSVQRGIDPRETPRRENTVDHQDTQQRSDQHMQ